MTPSFSRFLLVGALNTLFGYGCFAFLLFFGLHYAVALLVATALGVLFNFKSTGVLVFNSRDNRKLARFLAVYASVYLVNVAGLKVLAVMGLSPYLGGALLLLPIAFLAYVLNRRFVFNNG